MAKKGNKPKGLTESTVIGCENSIDAKDFQKKVEGKAYELYVNRGFKKGHDWDDWF